MTGKQGRLHVLMVGNDPSVHGGITQVIGQIRAHDWAASEIHVDFIPTYIASGRLRQIVFYLSALRRIRRALRTDPPQLVHIHMSFRGSYVRKNNVRALCRRFGVPYVLHLHGSQFEVWYDALGERRKKGVRRMLRDADAVIVMGERWQEIVRRIEPAAKAVIIRNAVRTPQMSSSGEAFRDPEAPSSGASFRDPEASSSGAACTGLKERFQVLFLGVLIPRKGVQDILEAARLLKESGRIGSLHFVIAGTGAEEERLRETVRAFSLQDAVTFAGWAEGEEKEKLLCTSQALVLPSRREGLPVAVLEALAHGLPVIASDVGDTAEAVRDGETGYLIAPGDVQMLAQRLLDLSSDPVRYERMSRAARRLAETEFSEERLYRQLEACWRATGGGGA